MRFALCGARVDKKSAMAFRTRAGLGPPNGLRKSWDDRDVFTNRNVTWHSDSKHWHSSIRCCANLHRRRYANIAVRTNQPEEIGRANTIHMPILNQPYRPDAVTRDEQELSLSSHNAWVGRR